MNSPHEFKNSNFLIRSYWLYLCDRWVGDSGTIEEKGRGGMAQSRRWKRGTQVGETEERRNGERKTETPKAEAEEEGGLSEWSSYMVFEFSLEFVQL